MLKNRDTGKWISEEEYNEMIAREYEDYVKECIENEDEIISLEAFIENDGINWIDEEREENDIMNQIEDEDDSFTS